MTLLILPEAKLNRRRADMFVNLGERFAVLNCLFKSVSSSVPLELNPFELL